MREPASLRLLRATRWSRASVRESAPAALARFALLLGLGPALPPCGPSIRRCLATFLLVAREDVLAVAQSRRVLLLFLLAPEPFEVPATARLSPPAAGRVL